MLKKHKKHGERNLNKTNQNTLQLNKRKSNKTQQNKAYLKRQKKRHNTEK